MIPAPIQLRVVHEDNPSSHSTARCSTGYSLLPFTGALFNRNLPAPIQQRVVQQDAPCSHSVARGSTGCSLLPFECALFNRFFLAVIRPREVQQDVHAGKIANGKPKGSPCLVALPLSAGRASLSEIADATSYPTDLSNKSLERNITLVTILAGQESRPTGRKGTLWK